jgi:DNA-binding MarR family transcriptional regulator
MVVKKITICLSIFAILFSPSFISAQGSQVGQNQSGEGIQQQERIQDPATHSVDTASPGNQVQNQNQVQIQNQSEDSQLMIETQEQEGLQVNKPNPRSQTARENMSQVAEKVEELLAIPGYQGGIGDQVKEIAQAQKQSQAQIETELDKLEAKSGFIKRLFGPDYKAIKNLNQQMEQNRLRIQQLKELVNQVQNQADQNQIEETIQALNQQNIALQEQIQAEEKIGSLFGWLLRLLNR